MPFKLSFALDTVMGLCVISALVIGAAFPEEYSYYAFLRWLVMSTFIYFGWQSYIKSEFGFLIFFVAIALMFNPFKIIWFQKETWHFIDYLIAFITFLIIVYRWIQVLHGKKQITKNSLSVRRYKRSKIVGLILIVISLFGWTVYFLERNNYLETTFVYHRSIINESIFPNRYRPPRPPRPPRSNSKNARNVRLALPAVPSAGRAFRS